MRVTMTETRGAADNGIDLQTYEAGQTYDVSPFLGQAFLEQGSAVIPAPGPEETKPAGPTVRKRKAARRAR